MVRSSFSGLLVVMVLLVASRPIMSQPIGPRGAPLVSLPGYFGPGTATKCDGMTTGWSYYGLSSGPTTTVTDSRVGLWKWGWDGEPRHPKAWANTFGRYGPLLPTYTPTPLVGGSDARRVFMTPPVYGYGLFALGYGSPFPRLATPNVSVRPIMSPTANCCRVDVRMPHPEAELWVNQTKTGTSGAERTFETPDLASGKEFRYELVAKWKQDGTEVTSTRSVTVASGTSVSVDFTERK